VLANRTRKIPDPCYEFRVGFIDIDDRRQTDIRASEKARQGNRLKTNSWHKAEMRGSPINVRGHPTKSPGRCRGFEFHPFKIGSVFRDDRSLAPWIAEFVIQADANNIVGVFVVDCYIASHGTSSA